MFSDERMEQIWWTLRITFGAVPIIAGLDKFFDLIAKWDMYLNPAVPSLLHIQPQTFMHFVGVVEICAGALVLSPLARYAAYVVCLWLVGISLNLISQGAFLDIAVRDLVLAVCAFSLGRLTEVRESVAVAAQPNAAIDHPRPRAIA